MAKSTRGRRRLSSHLRTTPCPLPSCRRWLHAKKGKSKSPCKAVRKDWEDATCSVCMEFPHNAVLLLCSSHDKGCRPYMCGTSYRYSNCLDRFRKACMKVENGGTSLGDWPLSDMSEIQELACPLCRGKVWGCTVVEPAREYLNMKKRSCMQDGCSFTGTYKELRKHVRAEHPSAKPQQVDPSLEQKWRRLEHEREREDVLSTIRSSMPGSLVLGDYVIDRTGFDTDEDVAFDGEGDHIGRGGFDPYVNGFLDFILTQAIGNSGNGSFASRLRRSHRTYRGLNEEGGGRLAWLPAITTNMPLHAISDEEEEEDDGDNDDVGMADLTSQGRDDHVRRAARRRRRRRSRSSRQGIGLT